MILQALAQYYERKRAADPDAVPEEGFERKEIPFLIVLAEDGRFLNLQDTREGEGAMRRGRVFTVPHSGKRTSGIQACLLWDKAEYVLGAVPEGSSSRDADKVAQRHIAFKRLIEDTFGAEPADVGVRAVLDFLRSGAFQGVWDHSLWVSGEATPASNFTFKVENDTCVVAERPEVANAVRAAGGHGDGPIAQCLVTGEHAPLAVLHPPIKGVKDAQPSGANIVSFDKPAFRTHGREKGANAPVSERAAFAYTTALNRLLARNSSLKAYVGDTTVVFWAERGNPMEDLAGALFGDDQAALDDPDTGVEKLRAIYNAPWQGFPPLKDDRSRFFVLGLAPSMARIAIRFWHPTTVSAIAAAVLKHFEDIHVDRPPWAATHPSVRSLLRSIAVLGKDENIPPNLAGAVLDAIISGGPYPRTLLAAAVQRIRAKPRADSPAEDVRLWADRAAVIKGCLVRATRRLHPTQPEAHVSLDPNNRNAGYLLGRLFAALERAQETASPGIQSGIRERYYASASATPTAAFPTLLKLKNHHLARIDNRGAVVNLERLLGTVMDGIDDFPSILSLADQGRFALGYYHQRQAFFTKPESTEERSDA